MKRFIYISLVLMATITGGAWGQNGDGALQLPYSCDFSSAEKFAEEWTVVNNNDDYFTWEFIDWGSGPDGNPGCVFCSTNTMTGNDDYLISSPLAMEAGTNHMSLVAKGARNDGTESFEILIGTSTDIGSMTLLKKYTVKSAQWQQKALNFNVDANGTYYIAIRSTSNGGFSTYIDDVMIGKGEMELTPSLTISDILTPYSQCDYSTETTIGAKIYNSGTGDAASVTLAYTLNGGTPVTETFDTTIPADSTVALYFKTPADMDAEGNYTIKMTLQSGESLSESEKSVSHKALLDKLPLEYDFSQGPVEDWAPYKAGSWTYDQFGSCYTSSTSGLDNGLFSRCIAINSPVRIKFAYAGTMFGDTCSMKLLIGQAGTDPSTWRAIYEDNNAPGEGTQKEISIYDLEPGQYTIAMINCSKSIDTPLSFYSISITSIYDYDIRAVETRTALAAYTPAKQFNSTGTYAMTVENRGTEAINKVSLSVGAGDETWFGSEQTTDIAPDGKASLTIQGTAPKAAAGDVVKGIFMKADIENEMYAADNRIDFNDITVTDSVFATENITEFTYGTGLSFQKAKFGNVYTLNAVDTLTSVTLGLATDEFYNKRDIGIAVYMLEKDGYKIGRKLFSTTTERGAEGGLRTFCFAPRLLQPGSYYVEIEQITEDNAGIATDPNNTSSSFYQSDGDSLYTIHGASPIALRMNFGHGAVIHAKDIALKKFTAPVKDEALYGINDSIGVVIENIGTSAVEGVKVTCLVDGVEKAEQTVSALPYETLEIMFRDIDLSAPGTHIITVEAVLDGDEYLANNTLERTITAREEADPYKLDFESCDNFDCGTMFNPRWRTVDRLGLPTNAWMFYDYPHKNEPVGFMAFNINATTPAITDIAGFYPHSGERFGAAFSTEFQPEVYENDVWLISPKLKLGDDSKLKLFVKTNEVGYYSKLERYRLLISDTNDSFESFTVIGGDREAAAEEWEEVNVDLSAYDGKDVYVALQYISTNSDGTVMMVDDIEVITNLQGTSIGSACNGGGDITISSGRNGVSINAGEEITHVYVYSPSGQMVYDYAPGARSHAIPSSALQAGLYIVKAETANGSKTAKVKM